MNQQDDKVVVIGAGMGGLAAALRLAHAGLSVHVLESAAGPGGKMRTLPSAAGPVDAGPTVLTMRHVFDQLFEEVGERLEDHLTLTPLPVLARHYWPDGSSLDLYHDHGRNVEAIAVFAGSRSATEFERFHGETLDLFEAFRAPVMEAPAPTLAGLTAHVLKQPRLIPAMAPLRSMAGRLAKQFSEPKLAQLFGRYATYVGGSPFAAPSLLSLIWQSEAQGVWTVQGGMHRLAQALEQLAKARGATFEYNAHVERIEVQDARVAAVVTDDGTRHRTVRTVFNGDPAALSEGLLGLRMRRAVSRAGVTPRSLSAWVHTFAAEVTGPELAYHTVFFGADPAMEFGPIAEGALPRDPTLYICAQDRAGPGPTPALERFEIIMNGAPVPLSDPDQQEDIEQCQTLVFETLRRFGLTFSPQPGAQSLTTPQDFRRLFPGSGGSLYGRSPHGMLAAFQRPQAQSRIPGLILAGGGVHPGAGIPMATLSGKHAAAAILADRTLTSPSRRTATPGGTLTGSQTAGHARYH